MIRHFILPTLAAFGLLFAVKTVFAGSTPIPAGEPVAQPAISPYSSFVAGAGIVEPISENISIASPLSGVVQTVHVSVGQQVEKGAPLFTLDSRAQSAERMVQLSALDVAKAQLADAKNLLTMRQAVSDSRAVSVEDLSSKKYAVQVAEARAAQAEAQLKLIETELDRLIVRAPISAQVLQIKVRAGEFAPAQIVTNPLMVLGDTSTLAVRVDVDENDAWRLKAQAPAKAFLRGNKEISSSLEFVRFEPFVVPKKSLTGESSERVDTRVLQVIYKFSPSSSKIFVGQLMDVFIESDLVQQVSASGGTHVAGAK